MIEKKYAENHNLPRTYEPRYNCINVYTMYGNMSDPF